jgi:hypothetical protein
MFSPQATDFKALDPSQARRENGRACCSLEGRRPCIGRPWAADPALGLYDIGRTTRRNGRAKIRLIGVSQ